MLSSSSEILHKYRYLLSITCGGIVKPISVDRGMECKGNLKERGLCLIISKK